MIDDASLQTMQQALTEKGLPTSLDALCACPETKSSGKFDELIARMDETLNHAVGARPSQREGSVDKGAVRLHDPGRGHDSELPEGLRDAVLTLHRNHEHAERDAFARVDRAVTSHEGYWPLQRRYSPATMSDAEAESMVGHLAGWAAGGPDFAAYDHAATRVVERIRLLTRFLQSSAGAHRNTLHQRLGTIRAAKSPVAPVHADVTRYTQHWKRLRCGVVRYIDVNPDYEKRTILLIHGHGSALEEYESLVPLLEPCARVIVPDLPGCGYSEKRSRNYTVGHFVECLIELVGALDVVPCIAAGGSLGGNLTLRLGLDHPHRFRSLVAWAPAGWIGRDRALSWLAERARNLGEPLFWWVYNQQKQRWYSPNWPGRSAALRSSDRLRSEIYSRAYHHAYFDIAAEQTGTSYAARAAEIRQPTLLMCGRHDDGLEMYHTVSTVLARTIPEVVFKDMFQFGRHSLASEDTAQLAGYIKEYLLA